MPHTAAPPALAPGFIALHGNRAEDLAQTVIAWLQRQPLGALEDEVVLVQSSGMAEWFKMEMARCNGICSATRVELPGRFLWRTYRQVLGPRAVPRESPLDKLPMTWRLMQLLPQLLERPAFAPVRGYLRGDEPDRQLQLASRLADLFDQYQNYRADWLEAWAGGRDLLYGPNGQPAPLPADQQWQAELWRALLGTLDAAQQQALRPRLHQQVLERLQGSEDYAGRIARRVVVYGMSQLPVATLQTLAALSRHSQVILAVPNPCRYYWGDIMEGRELLKSQHRRQRLRQGVELSTIPIEDMHQHAHPLLAAWGRQSRDFIRQLDAVEDAPGTGKPFALPRIDLFDEAPEDPRTPLLQRVQNRIRDLEPQHDESAQSPLPPDDQSITFRTAHSPVRELEILQDQLLQWLAAPATDTQAALQPRDVVVMVPDIESMAPAIRAVFGQYPRHDPRYIPFDIADLSARTSSPLIAAVEWLLRLPTQRCGLSELQRLLEVPALARRFGLAAEQHERLTRWMAGSGIRWGLHQAHRDSLGLAHCGEQNSAWFGLQRMLLGYASGSLHDLPDAAGWDGTEPYAEIGGLDAELAGILAHLLQALDHWWQTARNDLTPAQWVDAGRALMAALFLAGDESDQQALQALDEALGHWAQACSDAGYEAPLALSAMRLAWLEALELPSLERRFRAGGVTFCTLMPMRAVPFEVVCLLGMNDGDYPRKGLQNDFDLMALPGLQRPGDRSRRQDDRQLMLEALLSARRTLYLSWTGHSVRDNSVQPPSVLVSQLRDYLAAVWGEAVLETRTTAHPLQAFSRRYFESNASLPTYAREWRDLYTPPAPSTATASAVPAFVQDAAAPLTLQRLATFLRNPVKVFFRERLGVRFEDAEDELPDTEAFDLGGLDHYLLIQHLLRHWPEAPASAQLPAQIPADLQRLRRTGVLPMQGFGDLEQQALEDTLQRMARAWHSAAQPYPHAAARLSVSLQHEGVLLQDWIEPLYQQQPPGDTTPGPRAWLQREPGKLLDKDGAARPDKLITLWLHSLAAAASGMELHGVLVGQDAALHASPMPEAEARTQLQVLLRTWLQGMQQALPLPLKTGIALAVQLQGDTGPSPDRVYEGDENNASMAEVRDSCLARQFPDYDALESVPDPQGSDPWLHALAEAVYAPLLQWRHTHVQMLEVSA